MLDTKTLNLADVLSFSPCAINFVAANSREWVYFEQQILALLLVHQTHNLSRI